MKKLIAIFLVLAMMVPLCIAPGFAQEKTEPLKVKTAASLESAFAEGENSLIVFVTGIGQSHSYLFDESYTAPGAFKNGTLQDYENYAPLIADGKAEARWNLFNKFDEALADKNTINTIVKVVANLLLSMFTRRNTIKDEDVQALIKSMFRFNIVDEKGQLDKRVVTPRYEMAVADYPLSSDGKRCEAKEHFYSSIPCAEIAEAKLGAGYENYLYCYNYSAFSYTDDNVAGLHDFIVKAIANNKVGAKDVVLVPMSMGASVVNAYLAKYPSVSDNHVRRVVSIVGCWNGSDVLYDLVTQSYVNNSAELFYNGLIGQLVGEPWGYLVNVIIRIFPKAALRDFIDQALRIISEEVVLKTPSLLGLISDQRYEEVRTFIKSDAVKAQTDAYYQAQKNLAPRLSALEAQGVTFSFIAGYGLSYGEISSDYNMFGFMKHSDTTNSDEIIDISSTAPGTSFVKAGTQFKDTEGRILSPDKSIDISTALRKDSSWYFYRQKHELEHNNTAIKLALDLALGNVKTVADCDNLAEDGYYYPQFNEARNLKKLNRDYIPALENYCAQNNYTLNADQQKVYDKVKAMKANTVNDEDKDNAVIDEFFNMLVDMGIYSKPKQPNAFDKGVTKVLKGYNDFINKIYGPKGYGDIFQSMS